MPFFGLEHSAEPLPMGNGMLAIQGMHWHNNELSYLLWLIVKYPLKLSALGVQEAAALDHYNNNGDHKFCVCTKDYTEYTEHLQKEVTSPGSLNSQHESWSE